MNWLTKLERKWGRFAIPNLTLILIVCYGVGFVLQQIMPSLGFAFSLDPGSILRGQVWRLFTWILMPPTASTFTIIIMMLFYYSIGTSLERTWGAFRYNVYIFAGILFTIIGAFILHFLTGGIYGLFLGEHFSTYYINLSIFLAFAASYPDMQVLLYFVIPIKMKWMAIVYVVYVAYAFIMGSMVGRVAIVASLLNFIIFYLSTRNMNKYRPKEIKRKKQFKQAMHQARGSQNGPIHRCAVCGRTELDDPKLEFRYCSKCNGNYEYCQDHLFTHEHKK